MSNAISIISFARPCKSNPPTSTRIIRMNCCRSLRKKISPRPPWADVEEQIRELLVQRGISGLTAKWLDETKSRLKIELTPPGAKP